MEEQFDFLRLRYGRGTVLSQRTGQHYQLWGKQHLNWKKIKESTICYF